VQPLEVALKKAASITPFGNKIGASVPWCKWSVQMVALPAKYVDENTITCPGTVASSGMFFPRISCNRVQCVSINFGILSRTGSIMFSIEPTVCIAGVKVTLFLQGAPTIYVRDASRASWASPTVVSASGGSVTISGTGFCSDQLYVCVDSAGANTSAVVISTILLFATSLRCELVHWNQEFTACSLHAILHHSATLCSNIISLLFSTKPQLLPLCLES
jgi:hypothetical protein